MGGLRERNGRTEGRMEGKLGRREKGRKGTKRGRTWRGEVVRKEESGRRMSRKMGE